jgi:hypothetical protein
VPTVQRVIPLRLSPRSAAVPSTGPSTGQDAAIQQLNLPLVATTPGQNFAGISADGFIPPDTNGSVGDTQYVQIVNVDYAVYNKSTGTLLLGPTAIHNIWSDLPGADCAAGDGGDPVVVYDKAANRWVVGQLNAAFNSYCMAVSVNSDATGSYHRYEFLFSPYLPDYPKLAVWPDAYYFSANLFLYEGYFGYTFVGAEPCAFDRAKMLSGLAATMICMQQGQQVFGLLPSDQDGSTAPPTGEPNFYLSLGTVPGTLDLYKFHVDFGTTALSTFSAIPVAIPVTSFSEACGGGTCIPQPGGQQLDSLGDRLMYRLAYRNFGGHEALVVNHSVAAGNSVGVRWYEIHDPNGTPTVFQQGTFAPPTDSNYRWMGSIAMDQAGDIAMGYSESSSSMSPSIFYTGRVPSDPSGDMESEASIYNGTGSQTGQYGNRWGDYSSMSIDPIDDCTFFYTNESIAAGSPNWNTQIASFKFAGCGGPPPPPSPPPSAPVNLAASSPNTYQISLSWQEASGQNQTGFNISRCQGAGCTSFSQIASVAGTVFTYTDGSSSTPLTENTTYTYEVTAFNGGGESGPSNIFAATTRTEPAPANLTSRAGQTIRNGRRRDFVNLTWTNNSSDANGNSIERCAGSTCNFGQIATVGASSAAYTDNTVARFTTYRYRVRAHSPGGYSAYSSITTVTTP